MYELPESDIYDLSGGEALGPQTDVSIVISAEEDEPPAPQEVKTAHIIAPDDRQEEAALPVNTDTDRSGNKPSLDSTPEDDGSPEEEPNTSPEAHPAPLHKAAQGVVAAAVEPEQPASMADTANQPENQSLEQDLPEEETPEAAAHVDDIPPPDPPLPTLHGSAEGEEEDGEQPELEPNPKLMSEPESVPGEHRERPEEDAPSTPPLPEPVDKRSAGDKSLNDVEESAATRDKEGDDSPTPDTAGDAQREVVDYRKEFPGGIIREIDVAAEPEIAASAASMVTEQLLEDEEARDYVVDVMQGEIGHSLGVFENDQLIGVACVDVPEKGDAFVSYVVVDVAHRARGVGIQLMQSVEEYVVQAGGTALRFESLPDKDNPGRQGLVALLSRQGYQTFDPDQAYLYRKDLSR